MNQSLTRLGLALALCSGLFLSGCDDDDDNPSAPSSPAPVEPSPTPTPSAAPTPAPPDDTRPQVGERVNFTGKLKSVDGTELKVGSQSVVIDENTTYDRSGTPVTLDNFQIGELVRVRGTIMEDRATVLATRINIPAPTPEDDTTP